MPGSRDHYELLGLDADAPPEAIARAHQRQAVIVHRRGIFRLEERLRQMGDVARNLLDPERRRRYREERAFAATALLRRPPIEDRDRTRRQGKQLRETRQEIGESAVRMSIDAVSAHAEEMRQVAWDHHIHELSRKRALARRALVSRVGQLTMYATLLGVALYLWLNR